MVLELLKHLERDFASQLARTAARQEEVEETWYNIRLREAEAGKVYLGASVGGDSVELTGYDDESGRQRWQLLPEGRQGTGSASWHLLRLLGGTGKGRRLLSRGLRGLELCELDDSSGRQRWQVDCSLESCVLRAATGCGDPGLGAAAAVEAKAAGCCLGEAGGGVVLQALEMRWDIRGPAGRGAHSNGRLRGRTKCRSERGK
ncbi:unnamed protein product [Effrenium voratum]|nr:unnamed protein product [Effrenium voratum]